MPDTGDGPDLMTPITHTVCGNIAFHYLGQPVADELIDPGRAHLLDGSRPHPGDPMKCGSCGQRIYRPDLELEY